MKTILIFYLSVIPTQRYILISKEEAKKIITKIDSLNHLKKVNIQKDSIIFYYKNLSYEYEKTLHASFQKNALLENELDKKEKEIKNLKKKNKYLFIITTILISIEILRVLR